MSGLHDGPVGDTNCLLGFLRVSRPGLVAVEVTTSRVHDSNRLPKLLSRMTETIAQESAEHDNNATTPVLARIAGQLSTATLFPLFPPLTRDIRVPAALRESSGRVRVRSYLPAQG